MALSQPERNHIRTRVQGARTPEDFALYVKALGEHRKVKIVEGEAIRALGAVQQAHADACKQAREARDRANAGDDANELVAKAWAADQVCMVTADELQAAEERLREVKADLDALAADVDKMGAPFPSHTPVRPPRGG